MGRKKIKPSLFSENMIVYLDCLSSPPGSSVHGILQARILEWVAILFSRGVFPTQGTWVSCIAGRFFNVWATREAKDPGNNESIPGTHVMGFPGGASGKEPACQGRIHKRCRFDPGIRKIHWRRAWQPTPVFLPGESHRQRQVTVLGVAKSQTWLKYLSMHAPRLWFLIHSAIQ